MGMASRGNCETELSPPRLESTELILSAKLLLAGLALRSLLRVSVFSISSLLD